LGLAWYCTKCGEDKRIDLAYENAKKKKLGLWIDPHPISPMAMRTGQPCAVCSKKK
jgi:endonuclease YncB( thermonuclease family)